MKLLILGSNGQVGYSLVEKAEAGGLMYTAKDRTQLDITDYDRLLQIVADEKPGCVINATAYTNVEKAEEEKDLAFQVNATAVGNLARICAERDIPLIHISTDYVFDGSGEEAHSESDKVNPLNVYGRSKLAGEKAIIDSKGKYVILRTSWVFGRHGRNFVKTMVNLFKTRDELNVVADQVGGPTYAGDLAEAILQIAGFIEKNPDFSGWGIYNLAGKRDVSWYEFARSIYKACKNSGIHVRDVKINPVGSSEYKTRAVRPLNSKLNLTRIHQVFNIEPGDWQHEIEHNILCYEK